MKPLTSKQRKEYNEVKKCHICSKLFKDDDPKVRDHCQDTGEYSGPAHRNCNLRYRIPSYIPVIFHNLRGYDAHLFIRELGGETDKIGVIAENKEKYISFTTDVVVNKYLDNNNKEKEKKIQLRFIDSMRFMQSSLDLLSSNLVGLSGMTCDLCGESCEVTHIDQNCVAHANFRNCYSGYSKCQLNKNLIYNNFDNLRTGHTNEQFRSLLDKGVYPYEYMSSWDKFEETQLPPNHSIVNLT